MQRNRFKIKSAPSYLFPTYPEPGRLGIDDIKIKYTKYFMSTKQLNDIGYFIRVFDALLEITKAEDFWTKRKLTPPSALSEINSICQSALESLHKVGRHFKNKEQRESKVVEISNRQFSKVLEILRLQKEDATGILQKLIVPIERRFYSEILQLDRHIAIALYENGRHPKLATYLAFIQDICQMTYLFKGKNDLAVLHKITDILEDKLGYHHLPGHEYLQFEAIARVAQAEFTKDQELIKKQELKNSAKPGLFTSFLSALNIASPYQPLYGGVKAFLKIIIEHTVNEDFDIQPPNYDLNDFKNKVLSLSPEFRENEFAKEKAAENEAIEKEKEAEWRVTGEENDIPLQVVRKNN